MYGTTLVVPMTIRRARRRGSTVEAMTRTRTAVLIAVALLMVVAVWLFRQECAFGGGMAGWYQDCTCRGVEWVVADQTAADGPRRTLCVGLVTARTCYRYRGGPEVACASVPR